MVQATNSKLKVTAFVIIAVLVAISLVIVYVPLGPCISGSGGIAPCQGIGYGCQLQSLNLTTGNGKLGIAQDTKYNITDVYLAVSNSSSTPPSFTGSQVFYLSKMFYLVTNNVSLVFPIQNIRGCPVANDYIWLKSGSNYTVIATLNYGSYRYTIWERILNWLYRPA